MKKILFLLFVFIFISGSVFAVSIFEQKLKVITTSPYISSLVYEICKNKITAKNILFTSSPSSSLISLAKQENISLDDKTVKEIAKNNVVLYHSWQSWVKSLKYKISKFGIVYRPMRTEGNFMVPEINLKAAKEIMDLFSIWDGDNKEFYRENFVNYYDKVKAASDKVLKQSDKIKGIKIICNREITPFMEWLGCTVVADYTDLSSITSAEMKLLTKKIKDDNVKYIVDSLQEGTDAGRTFAEKMKIKHIAVSNLPLANSYVKTLEKNCETIFSQLAIRN